MIADGTWRTWTAMAALTLLGTLALRAVEPLPADATGPAPHSDAPPVTADEPAGGHMPEWIARLDAPRFETRQEATRELVAAGPAAVPYLVEVLGDASCERRVRARSVLSQHLAFEEVAPHLVAAVEKPYGLRVRELLRDRTLVQLDAAVQLPHVEKLFKFWGTSLETYREGILTQLVEAKTRAETNAAVAPLLGLRDKTDRFSDVASRLEALSVAYDGQYDPGFVIAKSLARGFQQNHAGWIAFAEQHLRALEQLVRELKRQQAAPHAIRKELSDRVSMSQGAAGFLVELLDEASPKRVLVVQRIGLTQRALADEFCHGLASPDAATCDRGVARVHIVDMLTEAIREWPALPDEGVIPRLIAATTETAIAGDKPKALSFLDALQACRDLPRHRLDIREGLGKQLGERLHGAAVEAPNNRAYSPARRLYDKVVALVDLGVGPEHSAFPRALLDQYLRGDGEATSDAQLLAIERYVRILERLRAAGVGLDQPGVKRFTLTLRDGLPARHELLAAGVNRLGQLLAEPPAPGGKIDGRALDQALGQWTDQVLAQ